MLKPRFRPGRKLLVASLGVAAISYVACGGEETSTFTDGGGSDVIINNDAVSGNLTPPPDAGPDARADAGDASSDASDASSDATSDANVKGDGSIVINDGGLVKDANKGD